MNHQRPHFLHSLSGLPWPPPLQCPCFDYFLVPALFLVGTPAFLPAAPSAAGGPEPQGCGWRAWTGTGTAGRGFLREKGACAALCSPHPALSRRVSHSTLSSASPASGTHSKNTSGNKPCVQEDEKVGFIVSKFMKIYTREQAEGSPWAGGSPGVQAMQSVGYLSTQGLPPPLHRPPSGIGDLSSPVSG